MAVKPKITPQRWNPPVAVTDRPALPLTNLTVHPLPGPAPEDVLPGDHGTLLTGLEDGRVIEYDPATREHRLIADTGGRPLGLAWHPDGSLVICDAVRGLLRYHDHRLDTLVSGHQGQPFTFCSNAIVAEDGTIYFSHASSKFRLDTWTGDILEHRPTGRLFRYSTDGELDLMLDGLGFANGVTLSADESSLIVAQTISYDVLELDLTGPTQGQARRFGDPMPGFPDNISTSADGDIWVSIVAPRVPFVDALLPRNPLWRKLLWALPERLQPQGERPIAVRVLDKAGVTRYDFGGTHSDFGNPTAVWQLGDRVWLAGIRSNALACFDAPGFDRSC
ncbi:SMP-30/gluconolactonase/LRE family protein [Nocardia vaccinii]|uniref:SMP-30/gluconolactonase/LRE family protein n=1 Tax=Nocardia vaccinii TaxID=1822 RepID=UPI00082B7E1D|nr:SMP-30/gluconolactonase/LRE family protein [Nocardia vaccinii]